MKNNDLLFKYYCLVLSKYGIEVDAGYIDENGIKIGDKISPTL